MQNPVDKMLEERGGRYGPFGENGDISQSLKQVCRELPSWALITPVMQEALDLIFTKISRILSGDPHYVDNWDDIAGYATLASKSCGTVPEEPVVLTLAQQCANLIMDLDIPTTGLKGIDVLDVRDAIVAKLLEVKS